VKIKSWLKAFRLRTLPLAFSSILLGCFLAAESGTFKWGTAIFALLTTLFLQILSNLANDYGDFVKGTDGDDRVGPERALQSGDISKKEMVMAIFLFSLLALISGICLLIVSLKPSNEFWFFLVLGFLAIAAAIKYTIGKKAYGYQGFGDFFVFIFFGITGVVGTFYLHTQQLIWEILLPASSVGLLSTAVLNLNNMRDYYSDKKCGKKTLVVKIGLAKAKKYHISLIVLSVVFALLFSILTDNYEWQLIYLLILPVLFLNIKKVINFEETKDLDPELKKIALATLIFALTFGVGLIIW